MSEYTEPKPPVWEAVDENGNVGGTWVERGTMTPDQIREYAKRYHPGLRLRVSRYTVETSWDES